MNEQPGDKVSPDGIVLPGVGMLFIRKIHCVPTLPAAIPLVAAMRRMLRL